MIANERIDYDQGELLRFITCGSVDDGKSTLIGRLLHDSKSIFEDQLAAVERTTRRRGVDGVDLSLLTDGLQAEREQGITIDVAYRYFATPKRKFIIADTPGHEQYTRNMVTGASTANLAVILIDARKGVLTQSRRHAYIASLLRIPHLVVAVNKMDLVDHRREVFADIREAFAEFAADLNFRDVIYIPISALNGDMIVERSDNLSRGILIASMLYAFIIPFIVEALTRKALIRLRLWGQPAVILGANDTAAGIISLMQRRPELGHIPVALFDDDSSKWGQTIHGIEVLGPLDAKLLVTPLRDERIVCEHVHAQAFGAFGDQSPDPPQPHDAQRLAGDLDPAELGALPRALNEASMRLRHVAGLRENQRDGVLGGRE